MKYGVNGIPWFESENFQSEPQIFSSETGGPVGGGGGGGGPHWRENPKDQARRGFRRSGADRRVVTGCGWLWGCGIGLGPMT